MLHDRLALALTLSFLLGACASSGAPSERPEPEDLGPATEPGGAPEDDMVYEPDEPDAEPVEPAHVVLQWMDAEGLVAISEGEERWGAQIYRSLGTGKELTLRGLELTKKQAGRPVDDGETVRRIAVSTNGERELIGLSAKTVGVRRSSDGRVLGSVELQIGCPHCSEHQSYYVSADLSQFVVATAQDRKPSGDASWASDLFLETLAVDDKFKSRRIYKGSARLPDQMAFSRDGRQIAFTETEQFERRIQLIEGKKIVGSWVEEYLPVRLFFANAGGAKSTHLVLFYTEHLFPNTSVRVLELKTGKFEDLPAEAQEGLGEIREFVQPPGSKYWLIGNETGAYTVWDAEAKSLAGKLTVKADGGLELQSETEAAVRAALRL